MSDQQVFVEMVVQTTRARETAASIGELANAIHRSLNHTMVFGYIPRSFEVGESILIPDGDTLTGLSFVHGYDVAHRRLVEFLFDYSAEGRTLSEICLKLAGHRDVREFCYGDRGRAIGNPALLGKLLLTLVPVLAEHGVKRLQCEPENEDLRRLYAIMGFRNGEMLDLLDEHAIRRLHTAAVRLGGTRLAEVR